jgi:hypothetical protein
LIDADKLISRLLHEATPESLAQAEAQMRQLAEKYLGGTSQIEEEAGANLLQSGCLPNRGAVVANLRSVSPWLNATREGISPPLDGILGGLFGNGAGEDVYRVCPMPSDPIALLLIRKALLQAAQELRLPSPYELYIDNEKISPRSLAHALFRKLQEPDASRQATVEAAIELYLEGSYHALGRAAYRLTTPGSLALSNPFLAARTAGRYAHAQVLLELLSSACPHERATTKALFETGTIAHFSLWARGTPPHFVKEFIREVNAELWGGVEGEAKPVGTAQYLEHLLRHGGNS